MAITTSRDEMHTIGKERVLIHGSFAPNGSSALASANTYGKGFTVARSGVGTFKVTLDDPIVEHAAVLVDVQSESSVPTFAVARDYSSTAGTLDIELYRGETRIIQLPITLARELSSNDIINIAGNGGLLASDTTPTLSAVNAGTDQQLVATWAASNNDKICWQVALPPDIDDASAMTFHAWAGMGGSTDTPVLTIEAFFGVGDTDAGGNTGALAAAAAEVSATIAAGDVPAAPSFLAVTLVPGAHTTDTALLYAAWLEYVAKTGAGNIVDISADDNCRVNFAVIARNTSYDF